jgi:hypothetical protein
LWPTPAALSVAEKVENPVVGFGRDRGNMTDPDEVDLIDDTPDDPSWAGRIAAHIAAIPEVDEDSIVLSEN